MKIQISEKHLSILENILKSYPYQFYVYDSRAKGSSKKFSDLDLCYKEEIPSKDLNQILELFENSDLPFKVDLCNWNEISDDFKQLIEQDFIPLTF